MTQIDWSKAPEGATHWEPKNVSIMTSWMKFERGNWWYWLNPKWVECRDVNMPAERVAAMIPRHTWNGDGLPPVGTVCEVEMHGDWYMCEVIAHKGNFVVCWVDCNNVTATSGVRLRPLRTPEQIAAEEREKAIEQMMEDYKYKEGPCTHHLLRSQAELIYDAGYRKVEGGDA